MAEVDIASLGIKVDATTADDASNKLDNLTKSGERAEQSAKGVASGSKQMQAAIMAAIGAINANTNAMGAFTDRLNGARTASTGAAAAVDSLEARTTRLRASCDPLGSAIGKVNMELAEARSLFDSGAIGAEEYGRQQTILNARIADFQRRQLLSNEAMGMGARSARLQSHEVLNLSRQFADIGVTAAMGMSPLMILVQQGPQIADVLQTARARGISATQAFAQMAEPLLRFLPLLGLIGTVGTIAFSALGLATREANKDVKDVQKEFDLTDKQMDRLKDKGTDLGFTMGDAFKGIGFAIKGVIADHFKEEIETTQKYWNMFLDDLEIALVGTAKGLLGIFIGTFYAIRDTWKMLPGAMGDVAIQAANFVIQAVQRMVNGSANLINGLIEKIPAWARPEGRVGKVDWKPLDNPYAGKASAAADVAGNSFGRGVIRAGSAVDSMGRRIRAGMNQSRRSRIEDDSGDPEKGRHPREHKPKESDEEKDYDRAIKGAESYLKALQKETEEIGKNRFEVKRLSTEREAADLMAKANATGNAGNIAKATALTIKMKEATEDWVKAENAEGIRKMNEELSDQAEALRFQNSLVGMNAEQQAKATKTREISIQILKLERDGYYDVAEGVRENAHAVIELTGAQAKWTDIADSAGRVATASRDMSNALKDATSSFGELFGTAGQGFADLINVMSDFQASQDESYAHLADLQKQYNQNQIDAATYQFEVQRTQDSMARAQISNYGNMLHAAKGFFKEGSTGWKVLEAAERVYRLFQFAMMIRSMFMDRAQTTSSVANSGARAAADGIAAVAKAIASLPFPLNIIAGAATLAFLVAIGVKMAGGGKGKGSASMGSSSSSATASDTYKGPRDEFGEPTSYYSVLRPGQTNVAGTWNRGSSAGSGSVSIGDTHLTVQGSLDSATLPQVRQMLDANREATIQQARSVVARDIAVSSTRQRLNGGR